MRRATRRIATRWRSFGKAVLSASIASVRNTKTKVLDSGLEELYCASWLDAGRRSLMGFGGAVTPPELVGNEEEPPLDMATGN